MRVFIVLVVGVLCLNFDASGYGGISLKEHWEQGQVTLHSGQVIQGDLQYDMKENVVILKTGELVRAFSSYTVRSFTITDELAPRKYFAVPYRQPKGIVQPLFFQIVFDGTFTLFVREREVGKDALRTTKLPTTKYHNESEKGVALQYYAYMPDGRFQEVTPSRRDLRQLFELNDEETKVLNRYIADENIDFTRQPDIIQLIYHFVAQAGSAKAVVSD